MLVSRCLPYGHLSMASATSRRPSTPHLFRHARVRQIVRQTKNLGLAQRQAGWSRLQTVYLTVGDAEARGLMQQVTD
jgi:hypothetical protein